MIDIKPAIVHGCLFAAALSKTLSLEAHFFTGQVFREQGQPDSIYEFQNINTYRRCLA
jgi:hypothetical protein